MKSVYWMAAAAAILLSSPLAHAGLIDNLTVSVLYPDTSTIYQGATDTLAIGSSLSCPGSSPVCTAGYFGEAVTFSATSTSITFTEECCFDYTAAAFNGFEFSDLDFADSGTVGSATLGSVSGIAELTQSEVTIASGDIFVNLEGFDDGGAGSFTLTLSESGGTTATPEPGPAALVGVGLTALVVRKRLRASRY